MSRSLSLERQALKQQAIVLRKMGWSQQRIADQVGVPRGTIKHWVGHNSKANKVTKRGSFGHNPTHTITTKPIFLSWCGKIEEAPSYVITPDALGLKIRGVARQVRGETMPEEDRFLTQAVG